MNAKPDRPQPSSQPRAQQSTPQQPSSPPQPGGQQAAARPRATRPAELQLAAGQRRTRPPADQTGAEHDLTKSGRLVSLDAFRGFIMIMLAASGFGVLQLTQLPADAPVWKDLDYATWQQIGFHFNHPAWVSNFDWGGVAFGFSFWDMIQPAFMFMVGVAMPYSYAKRQSLGHSGLRRTAHALWRALVLVLLGVFLSSAWARQTNWIFVNVLCQIGLGYMFVYLLLGQKWWLQWGALLLILVGYWGFFYSYTPPEGLDYAAVGAAEDTVFDDFRAPWSKNANAGHNVDVWLLNQFPRPDKDKFEYNDGGYVTLNFVPSMATMLLGVFCGQLLRSEKRWWQKFLLLVVGGAACVALGVLAGQYACPIVKRIWTPSWALFSGGWVILMLATFYLVFDLCRLRWLAFPLVVVGMNSIAMYIMGQLMRPWTTKQVQIHFEGLLQSLLGTQFLADDMYGHVIAPTSAFIVFWLIALWMYRQKFFVRI